MLQSEQILPRNYLSRNMKWYFVIKYKHGMNDYRFVMTYIDQQLSFSSRILDKPEMSLV